MICKLVVSRFGSAERMTDLSELAIRTSCSLLSPLQSSCSTYTDISTIPMYYARKMLQWTRALAIAGGRFARERGCDQRFGTRVLPS